MLTSLFGDLGSVLDPFGKKSRASGEPARPFAATAIMETSATSVNEEGQMVDRHQRDLVVTGSPAHAIREHFASTRADMDTASRVITLLDPLGVWATLVIKALSDAGGRPIERLNLREQTTLRTLAVIERTTLARRHEDTLKIYHADVRVPGRDNAEIPVALMERSHMTTVIVGPMDPPAIDSLLATLREATALPTWRCPHLVFLLPPSAVWIANKVNAVPWPQQVQVQVMNESLTSASSVWNAMLGQWNRVKSLPGWLAPGAPGMLGGQDFPIKVADLGPAPVRSSLIVGARPDAPTTGEGLAAAAAVMGRDARSHLDAEHAKNSLAELVGIDGLLCCAIVDASNGLIVAREQRAEDIDVERAAAACAQVLRSHRLAARSMGLPDHVEEVTVGTATRHQLLRTLSRHPELFLFVLLNKQRSNLSLARFKLMEVEKGLV
jgi:predicted regulator of Ras-like GTPase activity (Roadblock/LC7/MglB family)